MAWRKTYDGAEPQRVNKWLAQAGVCSRREAEELIARGKVSIDGKRVDDAGRKIAPGETLSLDGAAPLGAQATFALNKPVGIVSARPERAQIPAVRLLSRANHWGAPEANRPPARDAKLAPLGRLDQDSRGLLLLSEDGVLAKAVIGPQSDMDKEYLVRVSGPVSAKALGLLRSGLSLDGRQLRPALVREVEDGRLKFVLREGRKRQIRRMCSAVGLEVTDLFRVRIGPVALGELPEGRWRVLTSEERAAMLKA
jgi:23S rRNA pseudouridine2604 synthase